MDGVPSWARKGAQVVCVRWSNDDSYIARSFNLGSLTLREIYTIREVLIAPGGTAIRLEEIDNSGSGWFDSDLPYDVDRFEPLVEDSKEDGIEARLFHAKGLKHHNKKPSPVEGETA